MTVTFADVEALGTSDWQDAYARLDALGDGVVELALRGIGHANPEVRKWSAALMDHHGDARCVEALVAALKDSSPDVRRHAVHSLGCQACKGEALAMDVVGHLVAVAEGDESVRVRQVAAHMLGNQGADPRAAEALARILATATDKKLRFNAAWALSRHQK